MSDVRTIRALAHPVRIDLLEALSFYGPMTATEAGERIGESPTTCSFHLRQLAKYGFVEEAGGGKGRARPWKMTSIGVQFSASDDAEAEVALTALGRLLRERQFARFQTWLETRAMYPKRWRAAASESQSLFWVTVEELEALNEELVAHFMTRYRERLTDPATRPVGALPVELLLFTYPITPPDEER
ncbi:MAG: helix-turn-helix domain-containing protein [Actinomycetota bacterium]|nr:helix-turn-helix domain-containing protein [Actinomycetota bacterium]